MSCQNCGGTGWTTQVDEKGYSFARKCGCQNRSSEPIDGRVRPNSEECAYAAHTILGNARGPRTLSPHVAEWLADNMTSDRELQGFIRYALENMTGWNGLSELVLLLEGFRRDDRLKREAAQRVLRIEEAKREAALNPGEIKPLAIEGRLKPMPKPKSRPLSLPGPPLPELEKQLEKDLAAAPPVSEEERAQKAAELQRVVLERAKEKSVH